MSVALPSSSWPSWQRVAFRFAAVFFAVSTPYLIPSWYFPGLQGPISAAASVHYGALRAVREAVFPLAYTTTGAFAAYFITELMLAALATGLWSILGQGRPNYTTAHAWLRVYLRYFLAAVLLPYGATKLIPVQFPRPDLATLLTPLGQLDRFDLMWAFMGSSPTYGRFAGLLEMVGAGLLLFPRTTALGAALSLGALSNVVALNFAYGVNVKLPSTVYLLVAVALLVPSLPRVLRALFDLNSPRQEDRTSVADVETRSILLVLKAAVVLWLLVVPVHRAWNAYGIYSDGAALPPLYGIYQVLSSEGTAGWTRFAIAEREVAAIQDEWGNVERFRVQIDTARASLVLEPWSDRETTLTLTYSRVDDSELTLTGDLNGQPIRIRLRADDLTELPLRQPVR